MKFNNIQIDVFIILLLKLLYVARIRGYDDRIEADIKELSTMLEKIKTDQDFFTREVFMDDDEKGSISKYYGSEVTKANVYKLSHVLNIALSCEYSEIAYHYIKLIDMDIDECVSKVQEYAYLLPCRKAYKLKNCHTNYSTYVNDFMKHTEIMVLSLAYLKKFTKNPVFKYHEVLEYLLSWYTFTYHNFKIIYNWNHLFEKKPIKLTNYQIKSSLERFIVKRCRYPMDFESFSDQVDQNTRADVNGYIKTKGEKLKSLAIPNYDSVQTKSVINSSNAELRTLIEILKTQVPGGSIKIPMITDTEKLKDIMEVFNNSIKDSIDLDEIFQYNQTLIQVVYEVIIRYEITAVNIMIKQYTTVDESDMCFELLEIVKNYIKNFRDNALYEKSIILRRKLMKNKEYLASVCRFMKSTKKLEQIKKIVTSWENETKWVHDHDIKSNDEFGSFLESLSKIFIAAKFHPIVLNAIWERTEVVYEAKHIWVYERDMKLYTMYKRSVDSVLCEKISKTMEMLERIETDMKNCMTKPHNETCFSNFHNNLDEAIVNIANITLNAPPQYSLDWEKILLTLIHNKNNSRLFNAQEQKTFKEVEVKRLIRFLYTMHNLLSEKRFVLCSCGASGNPNAVGNCAGSVKGHWTENVKNIDKIEAVTELKYLMLYRKQFQIIIGRIEKLNDEFKSQMDIMIYWDGNKKNLRDVYDSYKEQVFDIQDAQDYANFFAKWVIAIPYTRFMLLVHGMVGDNSKDVIEKEINDIITIVDSFVNVFWFSNSLMYYYFIPLVVSLNKFIYGNSRDMQTISEEPYDEIGIINVVDIPAFKGDHSEWISEFSSEIEQLVTLLNLSEDEKEIMGHSK